MGCSVADAYFQLRNALENIYVRGVVPMRGDRLVSLRIAGDLPSDVGILRRQVSKQRAKSSIVDDKDPLQRNGAEQRPLLVIHPPADE